MRSFVFLFETKENLKKTLVFGYFWFVKPKINQIFGQNFYSQKPTEAPYIKQSLGIKLSAFRRHNQIKWNLLSINKWVSTQRAGQREPPGQVIRVIKTKLKFQMNFDWEEASVPSAQHFLYPRKSIVTFLVLITFHVFLLVHHTAKL